MAVSKAYLRMLTRVIKDRGKRAAVRKFLVKHDEEINTNKLVITREGKMYYEGSIGNLTYYKLWGKYHRRRKSSLTGKRFRKDKAFKGSRESAERFALANRLASKLYKMVDVEKKAYTLFCFLKKRAIALIKEGKTVDEAKELLIDYLRSFGMLKEERTTKAEALEETREQFNQTSEAETRTARQSININSTVKVFVAGVSYKVGILRLKKGFSTSYKIKDSQHNHLSLTSTKARTG